MTSTLLFLPFPLLGGFRLFFYHYLGKPSSYKGELSQCAQRMGKRAVGAESHIPTHTEVLGNEGAITRDADENSYRPLCAALWQY